MAYSKHRLSYKKELYYILCIVSFAVIMLFSFLGPGGYRDLKTLQEELEAQRKRVQALERSNQERRQSIEALQSNKEALERVVREKGYGRRNEIIQHLSPEPAENPK